MVRVRRSLSIGGLATVLCVTTLVLQPPEAHPPAVPVTPAAPMLITSAQFMCQHVMARGVIAARVAVSAPLPDRMSWGDWWKKGAALTNPPPPPGPRPPAPACARDGGEAKRTEVHPQGYLQHLEHVKCEIHSIVDVHW